MPKSNPVIALVVAQAANRVIGRNNQLPWHLPADLRHFKQVTLGKPIIMGRKTFESIGRPLPGRLNIVISSQAGWSSAGVETASGLQQAIAKAAVDDPEEIMVIGGSRVYSQALPLAQRIYLTQLQQAYEGDAYFPALNASQWREVVREEHAQEGGGVRYTFVTLERCRDSVTEKCVTRGD